MRETAPIRDGIDGAMLLVPAFAVHTLAMDFAIDVAYLNGDSEVMAITTMRPFRIGRPRFRAKAVLEAEAVVVTAGAATPRSGSSPSWKHSISA